MTATTDQIGRELKWAYPPIDPNRESTIVVAVGRKGGGKSHAGRRLFREWPEVDRLILDPSGDADPGEDMAAEDVTQPIPPRWPDRVDVAGLDGERPRYRTLRYVPNLLSKTWRDDLDRVLGLALWPKRHPVLIWGDEAGEIFPAGRTGPHGRVVLSQSRHYRISAIWTMPRAMDVDPLVIAQADRVLIFDLPNPDDRKRVAKLIGWTPANLDREIEETTRRGDFWHLMFTSGAGDIDRALWRCPPLPEE